jgi:small subunit ribosomal protein S21
VEAFFSEVSLTLHSEYPIIFLLWILKGGILVTEIKVSQNESIDEALRRFKRKCQRNGIISEIKKREHYEKPSEKKRKKAQAAARRKKRR